ncbi:helix-turn-helix domain-containing protein [Geodermatophilus nigrescens]|uniref:Transcriptional regulator, AraC family n=1 Tax=Geodermatophilus nigrescens TaxID=1070870 RepID=A0A1M5EVV2_9ACTN|nr:AraC family transcriptional regulator [Geodermatophilus nigrescens]SHF83221.1 transcriptional regulator, AraC family [Geodermatophilus nigrescens]
MSTDAAPATGLDPASREAWRSLPARRPEWTSPGSWSTVLVRRYAEPAVAEEFTTAPTRDSLLVVQRSGAYRLESRRGRRWVGADYRPGAMGVTAPGATSTLRWRPLEDGGRPASTVQVHLGAGLMEEASRSLGVAWDPARHPDVLVLEHPGVFASARALAAASEGGAPRLAGEALALAVAAQLVSAQPRDGRTLAPAPRGVRPLPDAAVRRVVDHLHAHLGREVGLDECAALVHLSRAHFLRAFTAATGLTPHRYLVRLRMDSAARLLRSTDLPVLDVAVAVGYAGTSHFAEAFRRDRGTSPSAYRRAVRGS